MFVNMHETKIHQKKKKIIQKILMNEAIYLNIHQNPHTPFLPPMRTVRKNITNFYFRILNSELTHENFIITTKHACWAQRLLSKNIKQTQRKTPHTWRQKNCIWVKKSNKIRWKRKQEMRWFCFNFLPWELYVRWSASRHLLWWKRVWLW